MDVDRRTRLLDVLLARTVGPVAGHTTEQRDALRRRTGPPLVSRLLHGRPGAGVTTADPLVPGGDDDVPVRLYTPPGPAPAGGRPRVVAFPGGGWVYAGLGTSSWLCSQVAAGVGALVAEVGYRTAPEHPAPAAHLDSYAATVWLAEHAHALGGLADRVALLGDGAGGTLAATVALDAHDRGRPSLAFQALICPATDLTLASPSIAEHADGPVLRRSDLRSCVDLYLGDLADPRDPLLSPLLAASHRGLPPALVVTAEHDPLRDDGLRYVDRLRVNGVAVQHAEVPGSAHGFFAFAGACRRTAAPAREILVAALRRALCGAAGPSAVSSPSAAG
jgi:acetyl esterase